MKRIIILPIIILLLTAFCPSVYAHSDEQKELEQQLDSELYRASDDDARTLIEEEGLEVGDPESINRLTVGSFFRRLWQMFTEELGKPLKMLGRLLAVTVIYAAAGNMYDNTGETGGSFSTVCTIAMTLMCSDILTDCMEGLKSSLETINTFMISYIPLYAAVTTAGGYPVTAGVYSSSTILLCECVQLICSKILIPLIGAVMAMTVISSADKGLRRAGLAESIKRFTARLLTVLMIIYTGVLTLQGHVSSSADALSAKTMRFAAASFIPVIGTNISEAFSAAKGAVCVIRSTFGTIGIFIVIFTAARPLLYLLSIRLVLWCAGVINDIMGLSQTSSLFRELDSVLSVGMSILIAASSAFVISTGAVMSAAGGG